MICKSLYAARSIHSVDRDPTALTNQRNQIYAKSEHIWPAFRNPDVPPSPFSYVLKIASRSRHVQDPLRNLFPTISSQWVPSESS